MAQGQQPPQTAPASRAASDFFLTLRLLSDAHPPRQREWLTEKVPTTGEVHRRYRSVSELRFKVTLTCFAALPNRHTSHFQRIWPRAYHSISGAVAGRSGYATPLCSSHQTIRQPGEPSRSSPSPGHHLQPSHHAGRATGGAAASTLSAVRHRPVVTPICHVSFTSS